MAPRTSRTSRHRPPTGPWKHGALPVIGLIGGIGSGKSLAAGLLAERGAFVIDADTVGHALLNQRPVRELVIAKFGEGILAPSEDDQPGPVIDRRALGAIVFSDPEALRALEAILHPRMRDTFARAIARTVRRGRASAVVLDAAILLEAGWDRLCDRILFIDVSRDCRLARLQQQRGWTEDVLDARERAQWPLEPKRTRADAVVSNEGSPEELAEGLGRAWTTLTSPPRAHAAGQERGGRDSAASGQPRQRSARRRAGAPPA